MEECKGRHYLEKKRGSKEISGQMNMRKHVAEYLSRKILRNANLDRSISR
jgi:hypothetical protein